MRYLLAILAIGGVIWAFNANSDEEQIYSSFPGSSFERQDCSELEPDNPYSDGSGHYAGFEWAENTGAGYCDGNSEAFNEGCEDYLEQESAYVLCINDL
jgi:hypothetical protein